MRTNASPDHARVKMGFGKCASEAVDGLTGTDTGNMIESPSYHADIAQRGRDAADNLHQEYMTSRDLSLSQ